MPKIILISTPHIEFGELLQLTLEENSDFQITLVDSGALMLEKASQNKYDLAILDTAISDNPFLSLAQKFQSLNPDSKLVVVMPQNEANLPDLSILQVHGFLSRPCYPSDLLKMVDDLIGGHGNENGNNVVEKTQAQKPFVSEEELMKNFASMTIEDTFESTSSDEEGTPPEEISHDTGDIDSTGQDSQPSQTTQPAGESETEAPGPIETQAFPDAEALIAEASAPKADVTTDEDEFAKELAALTLTYNQEKGKKGATETKLPNLDITIKSPFTPKNVEESNPDEVDNLAVTETALSESGFIPFSTNQDLPPFSGTAQNGPSDLHVDDTFHPPAEQAAASIPEIHMIDDEIKNLEKELDAARSTWNEIKQAEKPGIDFSDSKEGDQELSGKHTELSERYGRLAKEYQELALEHDVLAKEHARMAAKKASLVQQRIETNELSVSLSGLISGAISGTEAQAILIIKNADILCFSGDVDERAFGELASFLIRDWVRDGKGDLVRFVDLASIKTEFLVYSSVLKHDFILGLAYDTAIPLSKMRAFSGKVSRELDTPLMISKLETAAGMHGNGKKPAPSAGRETPSENPIDKLPVPPAETLPLDQGVLVSIPIEEEIDEGDLPSRSTSDLESQSGFEKSLQSEIDNLLQSDIVIDEDPQTQMPENQDTVMGISTVGADLADAEVPTLSDILQKTPKTRGKPGRKKVQGIETPENLQAHEIPVENAVFDEAPVISVNAIEITSGSAENKEDVDVGDILDRVRNQLESQYTPPQDDRDENELPGWFQEMAALPDGQDPGVDLGVTNQGVEGAQAAPYPKQNGQADTPVSTAQQPAQILQDVFNQLDSETQSESADNDEPDAGLINPFQPASTTPGEIPSIDQTSAGDDLTTELSGEEEHVPAVESWFESVHQPGQAETSPDEEIIFPWEENRGDQEPQHDESPTRPVSIWNRIEAEQVNPSAIGSNVLTSGEHEEISDTSRDEDTPVHKFLTSTADERKEGSSQELASPNFDELTPVISMPDDTPAQGASEVTSSSQIRKANRSRSTLAYTCILVPRLEDRPIDEEVAAELSNALQDTASKLGWELDKVQVSPDNMLWTVEVMPAVSPGNLVRIVRQRTTRKIFARFPKLKELIPVDDFWAPGFLVISGAEPPPASSLSDFIQQTRKRQKLINALTS